MLTDANVSIATVSKSHDFLRSSISHDDVPNDKKTSVDPCSTVHCMGVRTYLFGEGYLTFHQRFRLSDKRSFSTEVLTNL